VCDIEEFSMFLKICSNDKLKFRDFTFECSELLGSVGSYSEVGLLSRQDKLKIQRINRQK
jgi:hypothetical protein